MNTSTTVGIEVRAEGTQKAARDLADVDASLKKINTGLGGTAQPAGAAARGLSSVGASAKKAAEGLGSVSKFASTAKFDKIVSDLGAMGVKLNTSSLHAQKLARAMQQVERERAFRQLAQDAGLSTVKLAAFRAELGDTRGALATLTSGFAAAKLQILAWAAALALGGKAALDAALQMDRLDKAYTTIYGSGGAATSQLAYLQEVSNRLGLQFQSTAEAAKTFFAAGKGTSLEKDMNAIFEAVSSAGAALSLSQDDMHGAFIALGQMISKGKVQAEELRGQLGERLPRAFQLAAKAMGMTTAQLDKFMADGKLTAEDLLPKLAKVMQSEFGAAAEVASNGLQGAINRLSTEWTLFKSSLIDSKAAVAGINAVHGAVEILQSVFEKLKEYSSLFKAFAIGTGVTAGIAAFAVALKACLPVLILFKGALDVNAALAFAGGVMGIQKAMLALKAAMLAHPVLVFAAVLGTVAAAASYLGDAYGAEAEKLRILEGAQETATASAKELANAHKLSAQELENYIAKLEEQEQKLQEVEASVRARLSEQGFYGLEKMDMNNEYVANAFDNLNLDRPIEQLNAFERALEDAKASALKTNDWRALLAELEKIEREAKASGDYTDNLRRAVEDARAAARDAITFSVVFRETHEVYTKYVDEKKWRNRTEQDVVNEGLAALRRQREAKFAEYEGDYLKHTDTGRLEVLGKEKKELKEQIALVKASFAPQEKKNRQLQVLNGLLVETDKKIDGILKKGQKKNLGVEQAQRYIETIRAEISKLNGDLSASWEQKLKVKLDDIAKKGEDAHLSPGEVKGIREKYAAAADAKRVRDLADAYADLDARIAQGLGNDRLAREMAINKELEEERRKLDALAKTDRDRAKNEDYLTSLRGSLEKASTIKDAEAASEFYRELYELSGQYGLAQDEINRQLERQAENLRVTVGLTQEEVDLWLRMKELEASRDYADGITRGLMKWTGEYTNMAMQMEGFTTSTLDAMTEGLLDFTSRTSASFSDMTRSILQDLARITARMAMAGLIRTAVGFFSAPGGGTTTASVTGNSISGGWAEGFMSRGASYAAIVKHGGGMALEPSPTRRVPASLFEGAPRYHGGFINPASERAAIIRTDESVLTPGQMKAIAGAGGASVVNHITIVPPEGYEGKEARVGNATGGEDIRVTFGRIAAQQANIYGSELNVALRRQGTRMPVMRNGG